jgi:hypothetical protein
MVLSPSPPTSVVSSASTFFAKPPRSFGALGVEHEFLDRELHVDSKQDMAAALSDEKTRRKAGALRYSDCDAEAPFLVRAKKRVLKSRAARSRAAWRRSWRLRQS